MTGRSSCSSKLDEKGLEEPGESCDKYQPRSSGIYCKDSARVQGEKTTNAIVVNVKSLGSMGKTSELMALL